MKPLLTHLRHAALRMAIALSISVLVIIGFLLMMAMLIMPDPQPDITPTAITLNLIEPTSTITSPKTTVSNEPPHLSPQTPPTLPPDIVLASNAQIAPSAPMLDLPALSAEISPNMQPPTITKPNVDTNKVAIRSTSVPALAAATTTPAPTRAPHIRIEPIYPFKAQQRKIEGYVVIEFALNLSGEPTKLEVIDAKPQQLFERAALQAVKQWRYLPPKAAGEALQVKIEFKLK